MEQCHLQNTREDLFMENVAKTTANTSFWSAVERFANMGVNLSVQLVLARLLTPSDFGIVAMMTVFIGISQSVSECGVTNALIRKSDCNQEDYSTAFYLNLSISLILYVVLFITSPLIANYYNMPMIKDLLRVYSLVFIFEAVRIVQYSRLCKKMEFRVIARISASSVLLSGIIGVTMAYSGYGVWSLVFQMLSASFLYLVFLIFKERWFPDISFKKESFLYLWGFGSKMLLTGIISRIYLNINSLVIGRLYNSNILGLFNNGQRYGLFYPNLVDSIFVRNSLPILSMIQDDNMRLCVIYRRFVRLVSFVTFPICLLIVVLAKPIIIILLTEKWMGATIYLQLFAATALLIPANSINLNILQVKARTDLTLKAEVVKKGAGFILVFLVASSGPIYLAITSSFLALFSYYINVKCAKKVLGLSIRDQMSDFYGIFISSMISAIFVFFITYFLKINNIQMIIVGFSSGCLIYYILTRYIFKFDEYDKIGMIIKDLKNRK